MVSLCQMNIDSFPKWVDEVCGIYSSKDNLQPLFHVESLYNK